VPFTYFTFLCALLLCVSLHQGYHYTKNNSA
jgi:hypothetical protein